jgi:hypothetical protein
VVGAEDRIALEQVVRAHPGADQRAHQRAEAPYRRVDAAEQDGLVADRHAVIDEALARGARLRRELDRVVEVGVDEDRGVAA